MCDQCWMVNCEFILSEKVLINLLAYNRSKLVFFLIGIIYYPSPVFNRNIVIRMQIGGSQWGTSEISKG